MHERITHVARSCTFFKVFDIPVFWPVLLIYMIILIALTAQRREFYLQALQMTVYALGAFVKAPGSV